MKKITENVSLQKVISQKMMTELCTSPEARKFFADIGNNVQNLKNHCTKVTESLQDRPLLNDEPAEVRIAARLDKLQAVFTGFTTLTDPNSTLTDEAKKEEFSKLVDDFNQVLGGSDAQQETTFSEDVNQLLNEVGYDKLDAPEMNTLFQLAQAVLNAEMAWQNIEANISINNALREAENLNNEKNAFQTKKENLIGSMYQVDPELTGPELGGRAERIHGEMTQAQEKLNVLMSPEYAESLKRTHTEAEQLLVEKERQIREEEQMLIALREEADKIKNAEGYGLDALNSTGIHNLKSIDENIADLKGRQKNLDRELEFTKRANSEVKQAAKEKTTAQKNMTSVLKELKIEKEYGAFAVIQSRLKNASAAQGLMSELTKPENEPLLLPALASKGLIKGFSAPINPKEYTQEKLKKIDKIAEDFVALKKCISGAVAPNPDGTMSVDAPDEFFKSLDSGNNKFRPVAAIVGKYKDYCEKFVEKNLHTAEHLAYMYYNKLSVDGADKLKDAEIALENATKNLDALEIKKETARTEDSIRADMDSTKTAIEDNVFERKTYAQSCLSVFHAENIENPETVTSEKLALIGTKAYDEAQTKVANLSSSNKIMENKRACNDLRRKIEETSHDAHLADIHDKQVKAEQKKTQYTAAKKMSETYNALPEEYEAIRSKQASTKAALNNARGKDRFSQLADGLAATNDHILDATRAISHKNTEEFNRMKTSLDATVKLLRNPNATNEQKIAKLEELQGFAQKYIEEKGKQTRLFGGSAMRRARLAFANQIAQLSDKAIKQDREFKASEQYKTAGNRANEADMKRYGNEAEFFNDFKAEQKTVITRKKQQLQAANSRPNVVNRNDQPQKNTGIASHI